MHRATANQHRVGTPAVGWLADHFGTRSAFFVLMGIGLLAVLLVAFAMPETRPTKEMNDPGEAARADALGEVAPDASVVAKGECSTGAGEPAPSEARSAEPIAPAAGTEKPTASETGALPPEDVTSKPPARRRA